MTRFFQMGQRFARLTKEDIPMAHGHMRRTPLIPLVSEMKITNTIHVY